MKKKILIGIGIVVAILVSIPLLWFLLHEHEWQEATCTECKVCISCGKTEGEPLGHKWRAADCENPKTCLVCNLTEGEAIGHEWKEATCTTKKTCSRCKKEDGVVLGHDWDPNALCTDTPVCSRCLETKPRENHTWNKFNCVVAKACTKCSYTTDVYGYHEIKNRERCAYCDKPVQEADLKTNTWKNYLTYDFDVDSIYARFDSKYTPCFVGNGKVKLKFSLWQHGQNGIVRTKTEYVTIKLDNDGKGSGGRPDFDEKYDPNKWGCSISVVDISGYIRYIKD